MKLVNNTGCGAGVPTALTECAMKLKIILYIMLFPVAAFSQEVWTLQRCLDEGRKNSLDIQLRELDIVSAKATYRSPGMDFLPKVDFSASHNYSIGSTIDPATNNRVSSNIQTDNFSLNASLTLLDLNVFTQARRNKLAVLRANADKEATATEYSLSIMENYFNALYTQELLKVQLAQFENAVYNLKRIEKETELGSRPKSDLYDMQVSYALEENGIIETRQLLYNRKLQLIQLMNATGLSPDAMILDTKGYAEAFAENSDPVYENALKNYPAIVSAQLAEDIARKEMKMQKNKYLPVLGAYYSYSSFYYLPLNGLGTQGVNPFWTQLDDNKNHYVGVQLNVPIFNGLRNHRDVQVAKIEYQKKTVEAEQEKIKLRQLIEQETAKLQQAREIAQKLEKARTYADRSFTAAQAKFTHGLIEAVVFSASKNQLLTAEYDLLKAKYTVTYLTLKLKFIEHNAI